MCNWQHYINITDAWSELEYWQLIYNQFQSEKPKQDFFLNNIQIQCPKNTFQILSIMISYLWRTVLFSLLFVYFHTSFHHSKSFMSVTVQRKFIHSSITNTGRENPSRLIAITPNMRVVWQNRWYWFHPRIFPYFYFIFLPSFFGSLRAGSQMQALALSLVQGPGWNGEKFNLREEKKMRLYENCPPTPTTPPHP